MHPQKSRTHPQKSNICPRNSIKYRQRATYIHERTLHILNLEKQVEQTDELQKKVFT